jgi:hypothetical protein
MTRPLTPPAEPLPPFYQDLYHADILRLLQCNNLTATCGLDEWTCDAVTDVYDADNCNTKLLYSEAQSFRLTWRSGEGGSRVENIITRSYSESLGSWVPLVKARYPRMELYWFINRVKTVEFTRLELNVGDKRFDTIGIGPMYSLAELVTSSPYYLGIQLFASSLPAQSPLLIIDEECRALGASVLSGEAPVHILLDMLKDKDIIDH